MDEKIVGNIIRSSLSRAHGREVLGSVGNREPRLLPEFMWGAYSCVPSLRLVDAVALSCGLAPIPSVNLEWAMILLDTGVAKEAGLQNHLQAYIARLVVAEGSRRPFGELQLYSASGEEIPRMAHYDQGTAWVPRPSFISWAKLQGWKMPAAFLSRHDKLEARPGVTSSLENS